MSLFGNWANANSNQQQQQQPNAFGQPPGFGQQAQPATGFGGFGAQPQQPQQPGFGTSQPQNTFGGFGGTSTFTKPAGTFGGFGATTNQPAPTGFGGFGATAQPAGTTGFGQTAGAGPSNTGFSGFSGTTGGGWGNAGTAQTTTGFGAALTGTGQGTLNPPYQAFTERDPQAAGTTLHYQAISCMATYKNYSLEELRLQDYQANRKTASAAPPGFSQQQQTTGFGTAGTGFGQATNQPPTTGFGAFSAAKPAGTGLFGQTAQTTGTGFGGFGSNTAPTGGAPFGQNTQQPATAAFGQQQQPTTGFGGFGQNTQNTGTGFGTFGQNNQNKPFGGSFGQTQPTTGGLGTFGQQTQTQPTTGFGQTQQPATTGFGGFGANTSNQSKPGGLFGGYGQTQPATTGFGQPAQQQPATGGFGTGAFGAFGLNNNNQQQQQQQQPAAGGLFGQPPTTQQTQQQPAGTGLFSGFGLGQNQSNQQQQQGTGTTGLGGGLFGNKPSGGLFGAGFGANNTTSTIPNPLGGLGGTAQPALGLNTGGGLFGQNTNTNTLGGGLFGKPGGLFGTSNTAAPGAGLGPFGGIANNQSTLGGNTSNNLFGAFGQSTANNSTPTTNNLLISATQQPGLTAAVDQPINADLPIFKLLPPGPQSILISPPKKTTNFFQSITKHPATARHMTPLAQSQLRGFGSQPKPMFSTVLPRPGDPSLMRIPGRPFQPSLNTLSESRTKSNVEALRGSTPARQSVKKLIIDKPAGLSELSSIIQKATPGKAKPIFDGHLEAKVHDQDNEKLKGMVINPGLQRLTAPPVQPLTLQTVARRPASPVKAPPTAATDKAQEVNVANLEKGEYWTKPSIAELSKMPFPDLQNLKHFTCGRVGYGEVKFLQPVDLTACHSIHNIAGKIITFEDRECTVYPAESEKPARGEGLNVPAEIKLYGCWPVDKATREPIRDERHPKFAAHLRKLKSIPETHFTSYEPGKGEWVFEVQHFSRYGLNDDDEDEDETMDATAAAPPPIEGASLAITETLDMIQEDDGSDNESMTETMSPHEDDPSTAMIVVPHGHQEEPREDESNRIPWAARIGMEPDRMKQMQTSFFSTQTSAPLGAISKRKTIGSALPRTDSPTHLGKHPREAAVAEEHKRPPSVERASFDVPAVRTPIDPFTTINPTRKFHKVGKESIVDGRENIHKDAGLAFGRSFRVGWGPKGQLVHVGTICGPMDVSPPLDSLLSLKISKVPGLSSDVADEKQRVDDLLRLQVQHTTVEMGDDGIPYINTHKSLSFRTFMTPSSGDHDFESTLWKLGAALFDKLDLRVPPSMSAGALDRIENLRRKQAVGDWLRSAVAATVENAVASAPSINAQIFILLTGNQVERACHLAMEAHNFKLASLIAQIGGSPEFRRDMASQLIVWRESVADAWIDDDIRKIFALMTGDVTVVEASTSTDPFQKASDLRIDDGLDWKRTFGLQLWYGNYLEDTLLASVDAFEARIGRAQPKPWYLEDAVKKKGSLWMTRNEADALFELIKLSVDPAYGLENVLNPRAYTSSPLDYRCAWHVYMLLSRGLQAGDFSSDAASLAASAVTTNYAAQLEALGMYEHAVFVLLHLDDSRSRAHAVKELLNRNADRMDQFSVGILASLKIPDDWVALAKGSLYRSLARPYQAYQEFVKADDQLFAHDIAVFDLAPEVVVREDFDFMIKLFEPLDSSRIPVQQWEEGGKLFGQYAYAMQRIPDLITEFVNDGNGIPDAELREECEKLATVVLPRLMSALPRLLRHSVDVRHRAALDDMLSSLVLRANALDALGTAGRRVTLDMSMVESGVRLRAVHAAAFDRFCKTIEIEIGA